MKEQIRSNYVCSTTRMTDQQLQRVVEEKHEVAVLGGHLHACSQVHYAAQHLQVPADTKNHSSWIIQPRTLTVQSASGEQEASVGRGILRLVRQAQLPISERTERSKYRTRDNCVPRRSL